MATHTKLTDAYQEAAADVTALTIIQCPGLPKKPGAGTELVVAANMPNAAVRGIELKRGETITASLIADLGASGKLYARCVGGQATGEVLTM